MKDYIVDLVKDVYEFFNLNAAYVRLAKFEALVESGELEEMCSSEVHNLFGIKRISNEF